MRYAEMKMQNLAENSKDLAFAFWGSCQRKCPTVARNNLHSCFTHRRRYKHDAPVSASRLVGLGSTQPITILIQFSENSIISGLVSRSDFFFI